MSKTLKMIKDEMPKTMGELGHNLLYEDICQAMKEVEAGQSASAARITELESQLKKYTHELKTAYGTLQMYGVPELRAKSVANGIMVLINRIDRENECVLQELHRTKEKVAELESDCKAMAEEILTAHANRGKFNTNLNWIPCTCPACIIAAKYMEVEK